MRVWFYVVAVAVASAAGGACNQSNPAAPTRPGASAEISTEAAAGMGQPPFGPEQPPFNLQA